MTLLRLVLVVPPEHWVPEALAELPAQQAQPEPPEPPVQQAQPVRLGWPEHLVLREPPVQKSCPVRPVQPGH